MKEIAARICRDYLTGAWKTIAAEEIQLKRISGGLSNFLYHVSLPDNNNNSESGASTTTTSVKTASNVKRARKDSYTNLGPEPKEVILNSYDYG